MLKNQKISFYVAAAAALCGVIALIMLFVSNGTMGYPIQNSGTAILCAILAVIACACSLFVQMKNGSELIVSALRIIALGLIMAALTVTLADRAVVAGGLFTWNSLDSFAWSAFYTGVACIVFQVLMAMLILASGCMKQGAKAA